MRSILTEPWSFPLVQPIEHDPEEPWSNYPRGVLWALQGAGAKLEGMEIAFLGTDSTRFRVKFFRRLGSSNRRGRYAFDRF